MHTHTYIGVLGACVEWIYVAGAACVVRGKAGHTKPSDEVSVIEAD